MEQQQQQQQQSVLVVDKEKKKQKEKLIACLNLMRKLPPSKMQNNIDAIATIASDIEDEFVQKVDQPLQIGTDETNGNQYIQCEYNRDGDSYRSPWSNQYFPSMADAKFPSQNMRNIEIKAQILFEEYKKLYYETGVQSCYVWDKEDGSGFTFCFLIKKDVENKKGINLGEWNSTNLINVKIDQNKKEVDYKLTTTIIINMKVNSNDLGSLQIAGNVSRPMVARCQLNNTDEFHLAQIGKLIEENECQMRSQLESIYVGKTKEIIFRTRYIGSNDFKDYHSQLISEINKNIQNKNTKNSKQQ